MLSNLDSLQAAGIIEKDKSGECLWTWSYPSFSHGHKAFVLSKCYLHSQTNQKGPGTQLPFVYAQHDKLWFYLASASTSEDTSLKKVAHFCIVLVSKDFHPEKYSALSRLFSHVYDATGDPTQLLQRYLKIITSGKCNSNSNGSFNVRDFNSNNVHHASILKDVVSLFGIESIILYTAVLLKKKILVYEENILSLLEITRALTSFCVHRCDWSMLYPWVDDMTSLIHLPYFIAGVSQLDETLDGASYDVLVDVAEQKIEVSDHAKDSLSLGKIHKDIAKVMVQLSQDDAVTNQQLVQAVGRKTEEILAKLRSLVDDGKLSLESIKSRNFNPNTETFLVQLAAAEQLIQL